MKSPRHLGHGIFLGCTLFFFACGPSADAQERDRVLAAIDALRSSPSSEPARRIALAAALASQPAKTAEAIHARDACSTAYRLLAESNQAEADAQKGFDARDGSGSRSTLAALIDAQKKLKDAQGPMNECSVASTTLRLK